MPIDPVVIYTAAGVVGLALFFGTIKFAKGANINQPQPELFVCTECLTEGYRLKTIKGHSITTAFFFIVGVISWAFISIWFGAILFFFGIVYKIWRNSSVRHVCPRCKKDAMIPVDTPKGRRLMTDAGPAFVYERSIDAAISTTVHDVSVAPNSAVRITRTLGFFVVCGLILSILMWWKFGEIFGAINEHSKQLVPELQIPSNDEAAARSEESTPYYPKDMPSNVRLLVDKWGESYDACREEDEGNIATMKLCDEEPQLSFAIKKLGWCYGEDATSMAERKWKECIARTGEPIGYGQFYAKTITGMTIGKRYRFKACLSQTPCLGNSSGDSSQLVCSLDMSSFDDKSEHMKWLETGNNYCGEIVAEMMYSGQISILRLPGVNTGAAKNYRVFELEEDASEPTIPAYVAPGKDFKQETPPINQDPSKLEEFELDKTKNNLSADSPEMMVMRMLDYALDDGGLSHESEIQQIKLQIENAPRPGQGNKKAARVLNDQGLASSKDYDFNNAVKMFEEANKLDKSDIEIVSNLGFSYFKQGNLDLAQQAITTTLTMSPGRAIAWANLGEVFGAKGDISRAVACFSNTYRFSKDRLKTHQFMKKLNETEDVENVKQARAKAINWAEKSYPNI